ncbi:MAG: hypothetical protein Q8932_14245, partial [Bacteroidota bacterium]|nr:hypothetical protein [Bacteroidota bacterium]
PALSAPNEILGDVDEVLDTVIVFGVLDEYEVYSTLIPGESALNRKMSKVCLNQEENMDM